MKKVLFFLLYLALYFILIAGFLNLTLYTMLGGSFNNFLFTLKITIILLLPVVFFIVKDINSFFKFNFTKALKGVLAFLIMDILMFLNMHLNNIPFGIKLPFGWSGGCGNYKNTGFPFTAISYADPNTLCMNSANTIGSLLNLMFLMILTILIFRIAKIILGRYKKKKLHNSEINI